MTLLEAAKRVMRRNRRPMDCKEIMEKILSQGLWETQGKTPATTLYLAFVRDRERHGNRSEVLWVAKGQFALRRGPAPPARKSKKRGPRKGPIPRGR